LTSSPPNNDTSEKSTVVDVEKGDPDAEDTPIKPGVMVEIIDAKFLDVGDVVRVRNGSTPPADGTIVLGDTFFNESSLTGESRPVKKVPGDSVFLGTINQGRVVDVRMDVIGGQTM
jgi:P-type E1-E2 ATPase